MNKKYILYIISLLLFIRCHYLPGSNPYRRLPQGGVRPVHAQFKYAKDPYQLTNISLIDTNAIYLEKAYDRYAGPYHFDSTFHFYRFFSNGKVYCSNVLEHHPSINEMNNLWKGKPGYYKIKDNKLYIEIFTPWQGGTYNNEKVEIQGDSLIYYNTRWPNPLTIEKYISQVYVKVEIPDELLVSQPDW